MRSIVGRGVGLVLAAAALACAGCGWTARDSFIWDRQVVIPAQAVHPGE